MLRIRARDTANHPMAARILGMPSDDHRGCARTERERGELVPEVFLRRAGTRKAFEGGHLNASTVLAVDHERVIDVSRVDHRSGQMHPVQKTEARVAEVEADARARQTNEVMHRACGRRLEAVALH